MGQQKITAYASFIRYLLTAYIAKLEKKRMRATPLRPFRQYDIKVRKMLINLGLLVEKEEPSKKGHMAKYVYLTEKGEQFIEEYLKRYLEDETPAAFDDKDFESVR